jgi:hypothetical protein
VVQCLVPLRLAAMSNGATGRREYGVTYIQSGYVMRRDGKESNWRIPPETVQAAVSMLAAVPCFLDHADWFEYPSVRNLAGVTFDPEWNEGTQSVDGGLRLYDRPDLEWLRVLLDQIIDDQAEGKEDPGIGLSLSFFGRHDFVDVGEEPGEKYERVTMEITHVESCDIVFAVGAHGRVREILAAAGVAPAFAGVTWPNTKGALKDAEPMIGPQHLQEVFSMDPDEVTTQEEEQAAEAQPAAAPEVPPVASQTDVMQALTTMSSRIEQLTASLASALEPRVVQGMGHAPRSQANGGPRIYGMLDSRDQIEAAYMQLMGLPTSGPVHRLSGIRELYLLLTGDREFRGQINLDLVPEQLAYSNTGANADTTTMAELTRNVMNKALVAQLELLDEYNWWKMIARIDHFNSLQQVSWVRYGGIGYSSGVGLPTVAEKGEYQQLYWEDKRTTADWAKYGGYLPLSLEMIDRDDLQGWRDVPRQLATAEAVTISYTISALFTANSGAGADLSDSVGDGYAFNTTRGNLITQPLDQTNWDLAVDTMYKLTQLMNSNVAGEDRRIAARPKYALVPIELESQAITAVRSEAIAGDIASRRPVKRILPEENVITVPHWTNADNWAAMADPMLVPFVGVAFRFGEVPEIFMPSEANHILWLNDVLPVKVRWFFAVGVIDPRGAIKSNMS